MIFQIRHKEFGIFQGNCLGLGFWYPMSEMPEQGYCEFPSHEEAQKYIDFLCSSKCSGPLNREDLTIEAFDKTTSDEILHKASLSTR